MSELEIPERAYEAGERAASELNPRIASLRFQLDTAVEAAAPIIVAAAYRKRAENCPCGDCDALRTDADELDPEGGTS
jgi:hypothetical protein